MNQSSVSFSVFTKPWRQTPLPKLGEFVHGLGFDGIELPVRPGYQVEPENMTRGLPAAVKILAECGVKVFSIAGPTTEEAMAACAEAGVPIIRIMANLTVESYLESEAAWRREWDALTPLLERYGVTLGIQNHYGRFLCNAMGLRHILEQYDPKRIAAVSRTLSGSAPTARRRQWLSGNRTGPWGGTAWPPGRAWRQS